MRAAAFGALDRLAVAHRAARTKYRRDGNGGTLDDRAQPRRIAKPLAEHTVASEFLMQIPLSIWQTGDNAEKFKWVRIERLSSADARVYVTVAAPDLDQAARDVENEVHEARAVNGRHLRCPLSALALLRFALKQKKLSCVYFASRRLGHRLGEFTRWMARPDHDLIDVRERRVDFYSEVLTRQAACFEVLEQWMHRECTYRILRYESPSNLSHSALGYAKCAIVSRL